MAVRVIRALRDGGVRAILLKGRSFRELLFDEHEVRRYSDVDLLVSAGQLPRAGRILKAMGFLDVFAGAAPSETSPVATEFRNSQASIDVHHSLPGVTVADAVAWEVLSASTDTLAIDNAEVEVLSRAGRCLHVALNAASDSQDQSRRDVRRAVERLPLETWTESLELARRLGALPAFVVGLSLVPDGRRLWSSFGVEVDVPAGVLLRASAPPPLAIGLDRLITTPGIRRKVAFLARRLVPTRSGLRYWSPLARRGPWGEVLAYAWRPFHLVVHAPAAVAALRQARSATPGDAVVAPALASTRIRVLFFDHCAQLSGGELALLRLLPSLDGIDAHVVLAQDGPLVAKLADAGISTEVLPLTEKTRSMTKAKITAGRPPLAGAMHAGIHVLRLARRVRQLQPDLIHTNSLKAALYGAAAGRLARVPVVWHLRDRIADDYLPPSAVRLVRSLARSLPAAVIANSRATLDTLEGVPVATVHPGPVADRPRGRARATNVVVHDPVTFRPSGGETYRHSAGGPATRTLRIGMVGRLAPWKGQHVFLDAFARAFPSGPAEAVLVGAPLFGETDYEDQLRRQALSARLSDRVAFRGFQDDVAAELATFDIVVHASIIPEPFGQVVIEAMAMGLPVVAAAAGGPAEIVDHEVDGLLVPPGDVEALASALRRLAGDPELRERLGAAARERSEAFSPEKAASIVMTVYDEILNAPRTASRSAPRRRRYDAAGGAWSARPSADGEIAAVGSLSILSVFHSGVVGAWRQRERELRRLGHDVDLVTAKRWNEGGSMVEAETSGEPYVYEAATIGSHPFVFLYDPRPIIRCMRRTRYDVIDIHEEPASLAVAEILLLRMLFARKSQVVLYSAENVFKRYPFPYRVLERWAFASAGGVSVCNSAAQEILRRKGFSGRVDVIPLGVDTDLFSPLKTAGRHERYLRVGYVGRLTERKGVHVLLDAVARLPWCHLDLVGDGPQRDRLEESIRGRGLDDRVRILGHVAAENLVGVYRSFDVVVVPSLPTDAWQEQFGRVAVEAMASGVPLVVSDTGALVEVAGDAALHVPPGDSEALGEALQALWVDDDARNSLRSNALRAVDAYSWRSVAKRQGEFCTLVASRSR